MLKMISILLRVGPALFATATCPMEVLHAAGIERIAVTDTQITVHPEAGTTGTLKVVSVEPYDDYQSSRGWKIGGTNDGGVINFDREGSALLTFTAPSGSFDPQIENTTSPIETSKVRHLTMRVKVDGFSGTIPAAAHVFGGGGVASANFNIPADGTWQFARLDLSTISGSTTWSGQRTLSIDLPESVSYAAYQNAMISIDWIAVTDEADFSDPLRWSRWEKFWDLGYQPAITTADASSPIAFARYDGSIDRYYQKFHLVNGFTPVGNAHWVDDFSGLSYIEVTDHGFAHGGAGAGTGSVVNGVYRMTYSDPGGSPFEPQLATPNSEINGNQSRYLHARVRLLGYSGSDPTITATMLSTATGLSSVDASFVPNGAWQILHFDMQSGPDWGAHENIRLDLPNQAGANPDHYLGATLEVDWFAVNNSPTYDGTGPLAAYEFKYDFQIDRKLATTIPLKGRQGVDALPIILVTGWPNFPNLAKTIQTVNP